MTYAGARGRLELAAAPTSSRFAVQPKHDGQYAVAHTDRAGAIFAVTARSGREISTDLVGVDTGCPWSELVGEYSGHTEAGRRRAAHHGHDDLVVFDASRLDGRRLDAEPYRARRDLLYRARGRAMDVDDRPWSDDRSGNAHDASGQFCRRIPVGWRRLPIVEQQPARELENLWADQVGQGDVEGIVVVDLEAPIGRRGAKRKIKPLRDIDATVVRVGRRRATLHWLAAGKLFTVGTASKRLSVGQIWAVTHDGFYDDGTPRFARLQRHRYDLR
jgi:hypothetical protein